MFVAYEIETAQVEIIPPAVSTEVELFLTAYPLTPIPKEGLIVFKFPIE